MEAPQVTRELKRDALGRIERIDGPDGTQLRRVADGGRLPGSRAVARLLLARERRALEQLEGLAVARPPEQVPRLVSDDASLRGLPSLDGAVPDPRDVLIRSYLEGTPLWAATWLPADFFRALAKLVERLHEAGVCHNDLHKEPNVLVAPDGAPCVIDFQLASVHRRRGALFRSRAREDLRHVAKHERHYRSRGGTLVDPDAPPKGRRSMVAALWFRTGKPVYNVITRRLLRTEDGEPRRPKQGPWPSWGPPLEP